MDMDSLKIALVRDYNLTGVLRYLELSTASNLEYSKIHVNINSL